MMQDILWQVVAGVILMGISATATYMAVTRENQREGNKRIEDIETLLHGYGGTRVMEGLIDIIDQHDEDIDRMMSKQDDLADSLEEIRERYEELSERVDEINERCRDRKRGD